MCRLSGKQGPSLQRRAWGPGSATLQPITTLSSSMAAWANTSKHRLPPKRHLLLKQALTHRLCRHLQRSLSRLLVATAILAVGEGCNHILLGISIMLTSECMQKVLEAAAEIGQTGGASHQHLAASDPVLYGSRHALNDIKALSNTPPLHLPKEVPM